MSKRRNEDNQQQARYKYWMGLWCCNPDCRHGLAIETHHIIPFAKGGPSEFWNFIALCSQCHRRNGLHRGNPDKEIALFAWKCYRELEIYGFVLDEQKEPLLKDKLLAFKKNNEHLFVARDGKKGGLCAEEIEKELRPEGV